MQIKNEILNIAEIKVKENRNKIIGIDNLFKKFNEENKDIIKDLKNKSESKINSKTKNFNLGNSENDLAFKNEFNVKYLPKTKKSNIKTCNSSYMDESLFNYLDSLEIEVDNYNISPLYNKMNLKNDPETCKSLKKSRDSSTNFDNIVKKNNLKIQKRNSINLTMILSNSKNMC